MKCLRKHDMAICITFEHCFNMKHCIKSGRTNGSTNKFIVYNLLNKYVQMNLHEPIFNKDQGTTCLLINYTTNLKCLKQKKQLAINRIFMCEYCISYI
jgi:hypothetical protein